MNTNAIKYFLYARKSTEGEDRQITSIEDQISEVSKLAKELNTEIVDIISESKSAKEPGRSGFNEMLTRIEKGEAQGILCWKLNRLARNPIDGGRISWMLQQNIIKHIQTYGRDYKPTDNVIMMSVEFGMSNQYSKDLSVDIKRGARAKAERGWNPTSTLALGYIHNPKRHLDSKVDEIIPDENTFENVKKLWKLLLTGVYTISDIKREGDSFGLVNSSGNFYSVSSYHYIFSNEFYYGYFYWNDENGSKVRYLGKHKPMVSISQFNKIQTILNKRKWRFKKKYTFPYRGLIACGECNGFVTAEKKLQAICTHCKHKFSIKTKTFCPKCKIDISKMKNPSIIDKTYYHCTKKVKRDCSQGSITDLQIEEFVRNYLKKISIHIDFFKLMKRVLQRLNNDRNAKENKLLNRLKKRKTELENRVKNLIQMRADNEISSDQFQQMQRDNIDKLKVAELKIDSLDFAHTNWVKLMNEQLNFALHSQEKFEKGDEKTKKAIVSKLGSNLILKDKSLYFERLNELSVLQKCHKVYSDKKQKLEPNICIENKGQSNHFTPLFSALWSELNTIRTCHIDNILNK